MNVQGGFENINQSVDLSWAQNVNWCTIDKAGRENMRRPGYLSAGVFKRKKKMLVNSLPESFL